MNWKKLGVEEKKMAKFVTAGTSLSVDVEAGARETTVEGRYGKRKMFIIETKEFGAVYITPLRAIRLSDEVGDLTIGWMVITL